MAWQIDNAHSSVQFSVRHMMITNVRGEFERFSGDLNLNEDDPTQSTVKVEIETASINTREQRRDDHLRSADFFDAATYPTMTYVSKQVVRTGDNTAKMIGDLTIKDQTREVTLDVEFMGQGKNPWGATVAGFNARGKINRKDFGLNWNVALETGGWLVGDDINIAIELEVVKQAVTEAAAGD
ncbi:MAG TPA: YceI family protein [Aggregatilineaceae bacterium]|nr:YceI family protein [Aggregatilineaceae bacterium]